MTFDRCRARPSPPPHALALVLAVGAATWFLLACGGAQRPPTLEFVANAVAETAQLDVVVDEVDACLARLRGNSMNRPVRVTMAFAAGADGRFVFAGILPGHDTNAATDACVRAAARRSARALEPVAPGTRLVTHVDASQAWGHERLYWRRVRAVPLNGRWYPAAPQAHRPLSEYEAWERGLLRERITACHTRFGRPSTAPVTYRVEAVFRADGMVSRATVDGPGLEGRFRECMEDAVLSGRLSPLETGVHTYSAEVVVGGGDEE